MGESLDVSLSNQTVLYRLTAVLQANEQMSVKYKYKKSDQCFQNEIADSVFLCCLIGYFIKSCFY